MHRRHRKYLLQVVDTGLHKKVVEWKKSCNRENKILEPDPIILERTLEIIGRYFIGFDILTIPAPSHHKYGNYPIENIAEMVATVFNIEFAKLFPEHSGKKSGKHSFGALSKPVQKIEPLNCKTILVLDDIMTTGITGLVTCESICKAGGFPAFLAIG